MCMGETLNRSQEKTFAGGKNYPKLRTIHKYRATK